VVLPRRECLFSGVTGRAWDQEVGYELGQASEDLMASYITGLMIFAEFDTHGNSDMMRGYRPDLANQSISGD
jgi:hypothetical protein